MKRFMLDTNVYSAFKKNAPDAVQKIQEADEILICTTVLGELLAGFKCGGNESNNVNELEEFLDSPRVRFVPSDAETAPFYANIFKHLRVKGKPIPTNDMWIAASAMQYGCAVCTRDLHFEHVDGLLTVILEP